MSPASSFSSVVVVAESGCVAPNVSLRGESHRDDDRPSGMSFSDMSQCLTCSTQWERAVDDRRDLPGLDECLQGNQVFAVLSLDRRAQLPALDL
jgi:hypothetical protein